VTDRSISKNNSENSEHSVLQHLDKQQLIQHVQDLQEELRLSRAFSNIAIREQMTQFSSGAVEIAFLLKRSSRST